MKNKLIYILIFVISIIIVLAIIFGVKFAVNKQFSKVGVNEAASFSEEKNEPKPVSVENKTKTEETKEEKKDEVVLDAAALTQQIYAMNTEIGTLYIPKTGLNTPIYSNSSVSQMEKMPCFLYTTGELNKPGATLIVGHNKRNGKLFSNNKKIEEGDEFYFKDYEGKELKYVVYSKFITTDTDMTFLDPNETKPVMALSCCTDANDENRIIILGRAEV